MKNNLQIGGDHYMNIAYGSDNLEVLRHSGLGYVVVGSNAEIRGGAAVPLD